jgi:hypothetical protein
MVEYSIDFIYGVQIIGRNAQFPLQATLVEAIGEFDTFPMEIRGG